MKIIGLSKEGFDKEFIVTISDDELARLRGYNYTSSDGYTNPKVGDELAVSGMYIQIQKINSAKGTMSKVRKHLSEISDVLCEIDPLIPAAEATDDPR